MSGIHERERLSHRVGSVPSGGRCPCVVGHVSATSNSLQFPPRFGPPLALRDLTMGPLHDPVGGGALSISRPLGGVMASSKRANGLVLPSSGATGCAHPVAVLWALFGSPANPMPAPRPRSGVESHSVVSIPAVFLWEESRREVSFPAGARVSPSCLVEAPTDEASLR